MSIDYADAEANVKLAEEKNLRYGIIFQCRYNDTAKLVRRELDSGKLGKIISARCTLTWSRSDEYEYRLEQLRHSFNQREAIFRNMIRNAEDERIIRMRQSQLDKLIADFESQKNTIDETIKRVDIRTNLQVRGVLHVEG